ncbi:MAG: hypothetical protein JWM78_1573 [Verrucomicrobiaceae bacterium]|nr:hypothetical protein [Verrucomicrobiaceae bacterium]
MSDSSSKKLLETIAGIGGAAAGIYSGINLIIPLLFSALAAWLAKRFLPEQKKIIAPAFSVQCGYVLWLSLAFFTTGLFNNPNTADVAILIAGLAWLLIKPSFGPLYLLSAYQLLGLCFNSYLFYGAALGSPTHRALLVHVIWRVLALFYMSKVFRELRKRNSEVPVAL